MTLEHVAIWTENLEVLKAFYERHFGGIANPLYINPSTGFRSHFITFRSGARLEIMQKPGIPANANDTISNQHQGFIHMAFSVNSREEVDEKAIEFRAAGIPILRGPRTTGDGYYEFEALDPDQNRLEVMCRL